MFDWAYTGEYTLWVQGASFWLGVAGLLLGLVGFGLTIWQLRQVRSAVLAVRSEMSKVKSSLQLYDSNQELAKASRSLASAKRNLIKKEWQGLAQDYSEFLSAIHILRTLNVDVVVPYNDRMTEAMEYANRLCERVESVGDGDPNIDVAKTSSSIREHDQLLTSVNIALQGRVLQ